VAVTGAGGSPLPTAYYTELEFVFRLLHVKKVSLENIGV